MFIQFVRLAAVVLGLMAAATPVRAAEGPPVDDAAPVEAPRPPDRRPTAEELLAKVPLEKRTADVEAMVRAIASGRMGPNQGWFRPGESRLGWEWLRSQYDADGDDAVERDEFGGEAETFSRLDRDRSGRITSDDFAWSDNSPWMKQTGQVAQLFRRIDQTDDGVVDREEWLAVFTRLSRGAESITADELRPLLFPPPGPREAPSVETLIAGLISGEVGSHMPGPEVGDEAPDFELRTPDGSDVVRLSQFRGEKPVVLVFGSFT
ncbi:MAG: hypothetical protein KY476_14535 [Planctomycetes bacterium]|nr:hypothetical protein [Planctomycetota bacterium]